MSNKNNLVFENQIFAKDNHLTFTMDISILIMVALVQQYSMNS
jgi:hypothetical protein